MALLICSADFTTIVPLCRTHHEQYDTYAAPFDAHDVRGLLHGVVERDPVIVERVSGQSFSAFTRARIFAPLAEAYRKAGLVDEAIEVAREGLRIHPNFVGGRVALGRALFDDAEALDHHSPPLSATPMAR